MTNQQNREEKYTGPIKGIIGEAHAQNVEIHNDEEPIKIPTRQNREEWEKEFYKNVHMLISTLGDTYENYGYPRNYVSSHLYSTLNNFIEYTIDFIRSTRQSAAKDAREEVLNEMTDIFYWLLGYQDFPSRGENDGAYWWRKELREKLPREMIIKFKKRLLPNLNN